MNQSGSSTAWGKMPAASASRRAFLTAPTAAMADLTRPFGALQFITSGGAGNFAETNPQDRLIDMVHALASPYRQGAVWVMNSATLARIRPER